MKIIKKIVFFFSLFLVYLILKEFIELYNLAKSVHLYFAYAVIILLLFFLVYYAFIPVYQIFKIPKNYAPVKNKNEIPALLEKRIVNFRKNKYLLKSNFNFSETVNDEESYNKIISFLEKEADRIRKKYVSRLFYSTSISQNGFIDAILILSSSVNLIKEIFILYQGRVTNRDLFTIAKKVYYSIAIGGSEGVEYAMDEIFSKLSTEGMKSIPFASKILSSLADGYVNAALLTRVSLITENYCKYIYIESEKDLYPSSKFIISTTRFLTSDILAMVNRKLLKTPREKLENIIRKTPNPLAFILGKNKPDIKESDI
jgi:Domain of unknown function (DUF697)